MSRAARRVFALAFAALLAGAAARAAPESPICGTRGEPAARAVVRWSEMLRPAVQSRPASEEEDGGPLPIPQDLPVPKGALVRMEARAQAVALPSAAPPSPAPAASFAALPNGLPIPPDTTGAVGPNHLMVTLNSQIRIQDRSGNALSTVTLLDFWQRVSGIIDLSDPRITYDPYADRWIATAIGAFSSAQSALLVGVSQTGDPAGSWNLYKIDADASDVAWVDFPSLGFNKNWIVVQGNMFTVAQGAFKGTQIWVFGKANLYAGGSGSYTLLSDDTIGGTQSPAVTLDPAVSALYLLQNWNGNVNGTGFVRLYTITGSIGSEVLTPVSFVATPNPWSSAQPNGADLAPQMGEPMKINLGDARMQNVVFRNGAIWAAHTVFLPAGAATRSAAQWWQLAPDGGVVQRGRMDDASGVASYGYPSLAVNRAGDMLLGFASFSAQQFASGSYAYRAAGDPRGTLRAERVFKAGEDTYLRVFSDGRNRWGDYSGTSVDPVNDSDFWTIQEYAAARDPVSRAYRWGTWWGRVVPEPAVSGAPCVAGAAALCLNANRFQVSVAWSVPAQGASGEATAVPMTEDTGYFWFFSSNNVELVLKVLDGRAINGRFWVFYGALSNVEYTITVTDIETGAVRTYFNPSGQQASVADTSAF